MKKFFLSLAAALALGAPAMAETVTDVLTQESVGIKAGTTYGEYTYTGKSGATYALQCAGDKGSIQLRSSNNNSGVVVTKSAGKVLSVAIEWQSETVDARVLNVYESSEAYSAPSDLYATGLTAVTTFTKSDGNASYTFEPQPAFIGLRSNSSAMYITQISITWDTDGSAGDDGNTGGETPEQPGGGDLVNTTIYSGLASGATPSEGWTIEDSILPEGLNYVWSWDQTYGYKASAYVSSVNYAASSYLVSPVIDLTDVTEAKLAFNQAVNFLKGNSNLLSVNVREDEGEWQPITVTGWPTTDSWTFVPATADLSAYDGKSIQIGFLYTSTTYVGATWEIKDVKVTGLKESTGGEEPTPSGNEVSINWASMGYDNGTAITEVKKDPVTLTFSKGTGNNAPAYYASGTNLRLYNGNSMKVEIENGYVITSIAFTTSSGYNFNENVIANKGQFAIDGTSTTWTAPEKCGSVLFTQGGSAQVRLTDVVIYYEEGQADEEPEGPVAPKGEISVKEALEIIASGNIPTDAVEVKGIISAIEDYSVSYGNATYTLVDAEGDVNSIKVYRGKWLNDESFSEEGLIEVGGTVVVKGVLQDYQGSPQLSGSFVVSYTAPENGGGEEPDPDQPGDNSKQVTQVFKTGLGFPEGAQAAVPTEDTTVTASDTGITYTLFGTNVNTGNYLMMAGKVVEGAYISWTLDFPMVELQMTTTSGCSTNEANAVYVYADDDLLTEEPLKVNVQGATFTVVIPEEKQTAGTVYKVVSSSDKYNTQFASFTYVKRENSTDGVEGVVAADEAEAIYFNLQGVRVQNPERGIFVKVQNGKATKVVK